MESSDSSSSEEDVAAAPAPDSPGAPAQSPGPSPAPSSPPPPAVDEPDASQPPAPVGQSLFVLGSVLGCYEDSGGSGALQYVVDVGRKAVAPGSGTLKVESLAGAAMQYTNHGDEYGVLRPEGASGSRLEIGARVRYCPGYCDPTVNLYDFVVAVRDKVVQGVYRVDGRGL